MQSHIEPNWSSALSSFEQAKEKVVERYGKETDICSKVFMHVTKDGQLQFTAKARWWIFRFIQVLVLKYWLGKSQLLGQNSPAHFKEILANFVQRSGMPPRSSDLPRVIHGIFDHISRERFAKQKMSSDEQVKAQFQEAREIIDAPFLFKELDDVKKIFPGVTLPDALGTIHDKKEKILNQIAESAARMSLNEQTKAREALRSFNGQILLKEEIVQELGYGPEESRFVKTLLPQISEPGPQIAGKERRELLLSQIAGMLSSKTRDEIQKLSSAIDDYQECLFLKQDILRLCEVYLLSSKELAQTFSDVEKRPFVTKEISTGAGTLSTSGYLATDQMRKDDKELFLKVIWAQNLQFRPITADIVRNHGVGVIEKKDFPEGTEICVRADLHSDLSSTIAQLKLLQSKGYLDEEYRCRPGFHLVFVGDYTDRGLNDIELLTVLALLRMKNPGSVHLLQGNHESIDTKLFANVEPEFFVNHRIPIEQFYATMPLTHCVAEEKGNFNPENGIWQRQYVHFSHGLFSPAVSLGSFLADPKQSMLVVPEEPKFSNQAENKTQKADAAFQRLRAAFENSIATKARTINWADVAEHSLASGEGGPGKERPLFTSEDVHDYSRANASAYAKIGCFMRGHSHYLKEWAVARKKGGQKVIATTLAVGNTGGAFIHWNFAKETIQGVMLTVRPDVRSWQKRPMVVTGRDERTGLPSFQLSDKSVSMYEPLKAE